jgi:hypothetical protein
MLSSGLGVVGFSWAASPACTELETIVIGWLGKMSNLPSCLLPFEDVVVQEMDENMNSPAVKSTNIFFSEDAAAYVPHRGGCASVMSLSSCDRN